uniref:Hedgehog protein Hint domain-containing protein n=1 Tax=Chromera velia CCMP2878 TaxID=1169474 RepID=A0A0G4I1W3_9ALVE|eukprot:Cvel_10247.t1-p1 / transcript=Cvel_10247.t1 / gene=Cvel_10247 / organism=Chromera_velia_CCMP2878 / gene_product=Desert hedgehog protein B, putative / transcript_product=Desert hedgehog protein B, putative / location=Cvel_scaffold614:21696-27944(+) / protein_length=753 / sequence_SO=supercontig / SO=protein_coding / is_pseudo=false
MRSRIVSFLTVGAVLSVAAVTGLQHVAQTKAHMDPEPPVVMQEEEEMNTAFPPPLPGAVSSTPAPVAKEAKNIVNDFTESRSLLLNNMDQTCKTAFSMLDYSGKLNSWDDVFELVDEGFRALKARVEKTMHHPVAKLEEDLATVNTVVAALQHEHPTFDHSIEGMTEHAVCTAASLAADAEYEIADAIAHAKIQTDQLFAPLFASTPNSLLETVNGALLRGAGVQSFSSREHQGSVAQRFDNKNAQCTSNAQCWSPPDQGSFHFFPGVRRWCISGQCKDCYSDNDCKQTYHHGGHQYWYGPGNSYCDTVNHECVSCLNDAHCHTQMARFKSALTPEGRYTGWNNKIEGYHCYDNYCMDCSQDSHCPTALSAGFGSRQHLFNKCLTQIGKNMKFCAMCVTRWDCNKHADFANAKFPRCEDFSGVRRCAKTIYDQCGYDHDCPRIPGLLPGSTKPQKCLLRVNEGQCYDPNPLCFPSNSVVTSRTRGKILMADLEEGEEVRDHGGWTPVVFFGHRDEGENGPLAYLEISMDTGKALRISPNHLVFRVARHQEKEGVSGSLEAVMASEISVGDVLQVEDEEAKMKAAEVIDIDLQQGDGAFQPITASGRIIVDGVLASSYASISELPDELSMFRDPGFLHRLYTPLRVWHSCFGLCKGQRYGPLGTRLSPLMVWVRSVLTGPGGIFERTKWGDEHMHPAVDFVHSILRQAQGGDRVSDREKVGAVDTSHLPVVTRGLVVLLGAPFGIRHLFSGFSR